jgi:hypothetical protein
MSSAPSRSAKSDLTAEYLRERLDYDPETGVFTWKWHPDMAPNWNARWPGKTAGYNNNGYRQVDLKNSGYKLHRLAWLHTHGVWPPNEIDHINGKRDDNRLCNLRLATKNENMWNLTERQTNRTGLKGVTWCRREKRFLAQITQFRKHRHLGYFATPEEAHAAYVKAAQQLHGEFANPGTVSTVTTF